MKTSRPLNTPVTEVGEQPVAGDSQNAEPNTLTVRGTPRKRKPKKKIPVPVGIDESLKRGIHAAMRRSLIRDGTFISTDALNNLLRRSGGKCMLTGIPFSSEQSSGRRRPWLPSLDRIDSSKGYTDGNMRLVCSAVNIALNDWGDEVFWRIVESAIAHRRLPLSQDAVPKQEKITQELHSRAALPPHADGLKPNYDGGSKVKITVPLMSVDDIRFAASDLKTLARALEATAQMRADVLYRLGFARALVMQASTRLVARRPEISRARRKRSEVA